MENDEWIKFGHAIYDSRMAKRFRRNEHAHFDEILSYSRPGVEGRFHVGLSGLRNILHGLEHRLIVPKVVAISPINNRQ